MIAGLFYLLTGAPESTESKNCRRENYGPLEVTDCGAAGDGPLLVHTRLPRRFLVDCGFWMIHRNESFCRLVFNLRHSRALAQARSPGIVLKSIPIAHELCGDPILAAASKDGSCRSESFSYRSQGRTGQASLATVSTDSSVPDEPPVKYFLRTPEGQLVALGIFLQKGPHPSIYDRLGYGVAGGGGLGRTDPSIFYDRVIEPANGRYCMIYRMKGVFTGELRSCDGIDLEGSAGYAPGVVTQRDAAAMLCNRISAETSQPCDWNSIAVIHNALRRASDGTYHYLLVSRHRVQKKESAAGIPYVAFEYNEERTYHVDARTGSISLERVCESNCKPWAQPNN